MAKKIIDTSIGKKIIFATAVILALTSLFYFSNGVTAVYSQQQQQQQQSLNTTRNNASEPITMIDNMITSKDPPLYESTSAKLISQRVLNAYHQDDSRHSSPNEDYPLIESTIMETGNLRATGNVTNIGTWIDNYRAEGVTFNTG
ncbi:MAG: hypothetical protein ACRD8Z_04665, partial [Nitrososphaeraceae archaeon]